MKFNYSRNAPSSAVTLGEGEETEEVILVPGEQIEISEKFVELPNIQSLIEDGLLVVVPEDQAIAPSPDQPKPPRPFVNNEEGE